MKESMNTKNEERNGRGGKMRERKKSEGRNKWRKGKEEKAKGARISGWAASEGRGGDGKSEQAE